ncbi:hypothetical protein KAI87_11115, partial [Myxococcota bacterium]|nr:hypothetical protein [Myxococcota bacterium]
VMASQSPLMLEKMKVTPTTRFLSNDLLPGLFVFPKDIGPREGPVNTLNNQILVKLYEEGYKRYAK